MWTKFSIEYPCDAPQTCSYQTIVAHDANHFAVLHLPSQTSLRNWCTKRSSTVFDSFNEFAPGPFLSCRSIDMDCEVCSASCYPGCITEKEIMKVCVGKWWRIRVRRLEVHYGR
jgi:hypothetical protein